MRPLNLFAIILGAVCVASVLSLAWIAGAHAADLPPGMVLAPVGPTLLPAPSWLPSLLVPYWDFWLTLSSLGWILTHLRALLPGVGALGVVGKVFDLVAGNYLNAKNVN